MALGQGALSEQAVAGPNEPVETTYVAPTGDNVTIDLGGSYTPPPPGTVPVEMSPGAEPMALNFTSAYVRPQGNAVQLSFGDAVAVAEFSVATRQAQKASATASVGASAAVATKQGQKASATAAISIAGPAATKQGQKSAVTITAVTPAPYWLYDKSSSHKTMTPTTGASLVTAGMAYGDGAAGFNGTNGNAITVADSPDWVLAQTYTIEASASFNSSSPETSLVSQWSGTYGNASWALFITGGTLYWRFYNTSQVLQDTTVPFSPVPGQMYDFAVEKAGPSNNFVYLYIDGVRVASKDLPFNTHLDSTAPLYIGSVKDFEASLKHNGVIDEVRITNGVGRYQGENYTPAVFPEGAADPYWSNVVLLASFDQSAAAAPATASVAVAAKQAQKVNATLATAISAALATKQAQKSAATIAAAAPAGTGPSSTKWRLYITASIGSNYAAVRELEMRTAYNGPTVCVGGTASASSVYSSHVAANAFDGTAADWDSASSTDPKWLQYEFPTPQSIIEIAITASGWSAENPRDFQLQYWNGTSWVTTLSRTGEHTWATDEVRTFNDRAKQDWRLLVTAGYHGSYVALGEIELRTAAGGPDACVGGMAYGNSQYDANSGAAKAFDDSLATNWETASGAFPHWIRYWFTEPKDIVEYVLTASAAWANEGPKDWKLQRSDGLGGWVDVDSRTGEASWTASQSRTYAIASTVPSSSVAVATKQAQKALGTLTAQAASSVAASTKQGQKATATAATAGSATIATRQGQRASATLLAQSVGSFTVATKQGQRAAATTGTAIAVTASAKQAQRAAVTAILSSAGAIGTDQRQTSAAQIVALSPVSVAASTGQRQSAQANLFAAFPVLFSASTAQRQQIGATGSIMDTPLDYSMRAFQGQPYLQLRNRNKVNDGEAFQAQPYAIAKPYNREVAASLESTVAATTAQRQSTQGTLRATLAVTVATRQAQSPQVAITVTESLGPDSTVATTQAQAQAGTLQVSIAATAITKQQQTGAGSLAAVTSLQIATKQAQRNAGAGAISASSAATASQAQASNAAGTVSISFGVSSKQAQRPDAVASLSSSMTIAMAQAERANAQLLAGVAGLGASAQRQGSAGTLALATSMLGQSRQAQAVQAEAGTAIALSVSSAQGQKVQVSTGQAAEFAVEAGQSQSVAARGRLESGDNSTETAQAQDVRGTLGIAVAMSVATLQGQRNGAVVGIAADSAVTVGQVQHIGNTTFLVLESIVSVSTGQSQQSATGALDQYIPAVGALEGYTTFKPAVTGAVDTRLPVSAKFRSRPATGGRIKARPIP